MLQHHYTKFLTRIFKNALLAIANLTRRRLRSMLRFVKMFLSRKGKLSTQKPWESLMMSMQH